MKGVDLLEIDDFIPLLEKHFLLRDGGFSVPFRLNEVTPYHGHAAAGAGRAPFYLTFLGPAKPLLSHGIYHFSTEDGRDLSMFLVPVGQVDGGTIYQAVYN